MVIDHWSIKGLFLFSHRICSFLIKRHRSLRCFTFNNLGCFHQHLRSRLRTASLSIKQPTSAGKVLHLIKPPLLPADQQGSFKLLGCMVEAARVGICLACPEMSSFTFLPTASHLETDRSLVQVICCRVPVGTELQLPSRGLKMFVSTGHQSSSLNCLFLLQRHLCPLKLDQPSTSCLSLVEVNQAIK